MSVTIARPVPVLRPVALDVLLAMLVGGGGLLVVGSGFWGAVAGGLACASGLMIGFERPPVGVGLAVGALAAVVVAISDDARGDVVPLGNVPAASPRDEARDEAVVARDDGGRVDASERAIVAESPTSVVRDFYADLDGGRFAAAWALLAPDVRAGFGGFHAWRQGYETTLGHRVVDLRAAEQGVVRHVLVAIDRTPCGGRTERRFAVRWRLVRARGELHAADVSAVKLAGADPAAAC